MLLGIAVSARSCFSFGLFCSMLVCLVVQARLCVICGLVYQAFVFVCLIRFVCTVLVCLSRLMCVFDYARLCASVGLISQCYCVCWFK